MTAIQTLIDLIMRLGAELEFDTARHVECGAPAPVAVVWFDRCLPLCALGEEPVDLRVAPVLPVVAFDVGIASALESSGWQGIVHRLERTGAPLRVVVIGRNNKQTALAPALQSLDQMRLQEDEAALRARIIAELQPPASGRTIVLLQNELVDWAKHLRSAKPRSYSAESLFHRIGAID
jgi:hypothetical protein